MNHNAKAAVSYSWVTLYVGKKLNLISSNQISDHAIKFLIEHPDNINKYISELAYGTQENEIENLLKKTLESLKYQPIEESSPIWNLEKRKLRFCVINNLVNSINDLDAIVEEIDSIYSFFDYPKEMNHLVHYRPESGFRKIMSNGSVRIETPKDYLQKLNDFVRTEQHVLSKL